MTDLPTDQPNQVQLEGVYVWWAESDPNTIHLTSDDRRMVDDDGKRTGLNIAVGRGRPKPFRRLTLLLRSEGKRSPTLKSDDT